MFLGKKSQKFSFFPLSSYTRAKSWKYKFISTIPLPMAITQRRKKENSLCIFFKLSFIRIVSFGTSFNSKYASHQIPELGRH